MSQELGALVAVGNTSTIHEWGRTQIVKVMLPDTPSRWADLEADWTAQVHAIGLPVPEVIDVIEVDGRRAIVCERIAGPTLLAQVVDRPASVAANARAMAELQAWFHSVTAPPGLPSLRARLTAKIHEADLPATVRDTALARLAALPDGVQVCHGDLHPGNMIVADGRVVVVDWFDVTAGSPLADVARTSLLIRPRLRTGPPRYLPGASNRLLRAFHDAYLEAYAAITGERLDLVADWEIPVAAARMSENVEHDDLEVIVRGALPSGRDDDGEVVHASRSAVLSDGPG